MISGLKHQELVALNSTLLHELYFASLGGDGKPIELLADALVKMRDDVKQGDHVHLADARHRGLIGDT